MSAANLYKMYEKSCKTDFRWPLVVVVGGTFARSLSVIVHFLLLQSLEDREKRHSGHKEQLAREQRYLRRRLGQLRNTRDVTTRSLSETSLPHAHATRADSLSSLESSSGVSTADRSPSSVSESGKSSFVFLLARFTSRVSIVDIKVGYLGTKEKR